MKHPIKPYLPVLISGCMLLILSFGYRAGFGLFMQPMSEARGWGRDVLALALAVQNLAWGVCAAVVGGLADKYGNLRVLLTSVILYAVGMWTMAYSVNEAQIVSSGGLLVGAGIAGTSFGIVLPAIARALPAERRAWGLGLGTAAGSMGQFLVVPMMQFVVDWVGWFYALQVLGASALVMAVFALPLARYGGADTGADDDGDAAAVGLKRVALQAGRVRSYQLLVSGFFVCGFHLAFIVAHMPGYIVDLGYSAQVGAWSISLIGLCNIFGAYYAGVLSSRFPSAKILTFIYLARVAVIAAFLLAPVSVFSILLFSAGMGFLWLATVPPTSGLVALFFGTRYMTFLYGIVFLSHQLGSFVGVWLGGWLYETYGDYNGIWLACIALGLIAGALHWPINERNYSNRLYAPA